MSDSSPTHDSPPPPSITGGVSEPAVANESDTNAKCQTALQSLSSIVTTARDHPSHNLPPPRRQRRLRRDLLSPPTPRLRRRRQQPLPLALRYLPVRGASPPAPRPPLRPLNRWTLPLRQPQAGFEAVLLALYAHETTSRAGQAVTVNIPDLSHPSIYHESKGPAKNNSTCLNIAVISSTLDPHGTVRSTRRARIFGVALELYYGKISMMPRESKLNFCESCEKWAGPNGEREEQKPRALIPEEESVAVGGRSEKDSGRIPLPWELVQPILRILGHCCLMGMKGEEDREVSEAASKACQSLYLRSLHDINPKAILATGSLLRLREMALDPKNQIDHTEISSDNVLSV
ncbi:unnamed protein product [Brassica oleracea]